MPSAGITPLRKFGIAALLGAGTGASLLLWKFDPTKAGFFPACPFHTLTGFYCPGCGTTRALHALIAHGDLAAAVRYNVLAVTLLPVALLLAAGELTGRQWSTAIPARWVWVLFWFVSAYWFARNLPYYPWSLLAPH